MSGFSDLVLRAQPRLLDFDFGTTEGRDWKFKLTDFYDGAGTVIDLSGVTFVCKVLTAVDGTEVAAWTVTGAADGSMTGVLADGSTGSLAGSSNPRRCVWYCKATLSGDVIQFWGPSNSNFYINPE